LTGNDFAGSIGTQTYLMKLILDRIGLMIYSQIKSSFGDKQIYNY